jgi:hypothetical protein
MSAAAEADLSDDERAALIGTPPNLRSGTYRHELSEQV